MKTPRLHGPAMHRQLCRLPTMLLAALVLWLAPGFAPGEGAPDVKLDLTWQFAVGFGAEDERHAYQGDLVYLQVHLTDRDGQPLADHTLRASSANGNMIIEEEVHTDPEGVTEVMVVAERLGEDVIAVSGAGASASLTFQVDEPPVDDFAAYAEQMAVPEMEGVLSWRDLEGVEVEYRDYLMTARFPSELKALDGTEVRIAGYMTPLENSERQRHFVISSQPPHCFFHFMGGPASVAEVLSPDGVRFSYDPVILSGRLELIESSDLGILYRLADATVVDKAVPTPGGR